jgi:hypothetical protein
MFTSNPAFSSASCPLPSSNFLFLTMLQANFYFPCRWTIQQWWMRRKIRGVLVRGSSLQMGALYWSRSSCPRRFIVFQDPYPSLLPNHFSPLTIVSFLSISKTSPKSGIERMIWEASNARHQKKDLSVQYKIDP